MADGDIFIRFFVLILHGKSSVPLVFMRVPEDAKEVSDNSSMESEIARLVNQLYGLTEDDGEYQSSEIKIVECCE